MYLPDSPIDIQGLNNAATTKIVDATRRIFKYLFQSENRQDDFRINTEAHGQAEENLLTLVGIVRPQLLRRV